MQLYTVKPVSKVQTLVFCLLLAGGKFAAGGSHGGACAIKDIRRVGVGAAAQWSRAGNNQIAFMVKDDKGVYQVHTMRPDGAEEKCLTCAPVPNAPPVGVHKGVPDWDPSGRYLVLQAEMVGHVGPKWLAEPGAAWWNNLWAMTVDGQHFFRLTDYSHVRAAGALMPRFSHDGKKLVWSEMIEGPKSNRMRTGPFGRWQLHLADFVVQGGLPRLDSIQTLTPGNGIFYEPQDWSPDDRKIIFSSDIGRPSPFVMGIFEYDLRTHQLAALSKNKSQYEEQGSFSPSGKKIVYMSSRSDPIFNPTNMQTFLKTLRAEVFLMNADSSNSEQLTHFNTPGHPEYTEEPSTATKAAWSPNGRQLLAEQQMAGASYLTNQRSRLWLVTFAGACGEE